MFYRRPKKRESENDRYLPVWDPQKAASSGVKESSAKNEQTVVVKEEKGDAGSSSAARIEKKLGELKNYKNAALTLLPELSCEEPELSEEQLQINDQAQEDELLAMESIYGDNVIILDRQKGLRCFQIHIHVETVEVSVSAKLNSSAGDDSPDFSFQVEYLPPIILTCILPCSYPSHGPPYFTILVQWLDTSRISSLCDTLDSIWNEQSGQEVIYHWVEWLCSSGLSFLGFAEEIKLGPYGGMQERGKRAKSRSISAEVDIQSIRIYNEEQRTEKFLTNLHECCICFSEFPGPEFARLPCQQFFCWTCMKTYSDMHVKEGTVHKLLCPDQKCKGVVPPSLLRQLLSNEDFERWESMMLQGALEVMSDVTYCPRCDTFCVEEEDNHALCFKCFFSFCTLCRDRRHVGTPCMTTEMKLLTLKELHNSSQSSELLKQREQELINHLLSMKFIYNSTKQCPSCKMAISRTEGCNHMVCGRCGKHFCYRCNKELKDGYKHFWDGECKLYSRLEVQKGDFEERGTGTSDKVHQCPKCQHINVKVGSDNFIVCRGCQTSYCYYCMKRVMQSATHYGREGGCVQHTD